MPLQAVIFDFDGLILDTETPEATGWEKEFARHGLSIPDGWWAGLTGRGPEEVLEWPEDLLVRLLGEPIDREATLARVNEVRLAGIEAAQILPGVREVVEQAKELDLEVAIASSSKRDWIEGHMKRRWNPHPFLIMATRERVARAKPQPDLYLLAASELGVPPANCLALEDSPNGIAAAKAAGMICVAVPNSVTKQLDLSQADQVLDSLEQLDLKQWL